MRKEENNVVTLLLLHCNFHVIENRIFCTFPFLSLPLVLSKKTASLHTHYCAGWHTNGLLSKVGHTWKRCRKM